MSSVKDYGDFEMSWENWVTPEEQSYVLGVLRKYLPTLSRCEDLIYHANGERIRISIRIEYPYDLEPDTGRLAFDLWYQDSHYEGGSIGFHMVVYKDQGDTTHAGPPIGGVYLHKENWAPRYDPEAA